MKFLFSCQILKLKQYYRYILEVCTLYIKDHVSLLHIYIFYTGRIIYLCMYTMFYVHIYPLTRNKDYI